MPQALGRGDETAWDRGHAYGRVGGINLDRIIGGVKRDFLALLLVPHPIHLFLLLFLA